MRLPRPGHARRSALADFSLYALTETDVPDLLRAAAETAGRSLGADYASAYMLQPDGEALVLVAGYGWDGPDEPLTCDLDADRPAAEAVRLGRSVIVGRHRGPGSPEPALADRVRLVSSAAVVIRVAGQPYGALAVYSRRARAFGRGDLPFLRSLVNVASAAIARERAAGAAKGLAVIVESSQDAIFSRGLDGIVTTWNAAAERLYGYSAEEIVGRSLMPLCPPDYLWQLDDLNARVQRGEVVPNFETVRLHKDGTRLDVAATISPITDERGRITSISVISRAIDEEKKRRAEMQRLLVAEQTAREAAELAGERLAFLAEASDVLAQSLDPEETLRRFAELSVERIADWTIVYRLDDEGNLVRDLLAAARPEEQAKARLLLGKRPPAHGMNAFAKVLAGESVLLPEITDDMLVGQMADDHDAIAVWREVGIRSSLLVPLEARGRVIGALCLMSSRPGRRFAEADLSLAQELGRRVALAAENAKLYEQAQQEIERRRRIEDALRRSEEQYRLLFETNPNPMWFFDTETLRFLAVNEAAVRKYGYTREEFLSLRSTDIRPADEVERHLASVREATASGGLASAGRFRHRRKDGSLLHVEITAQPLEFEGRHAQVVLAVDVTERVEAEEAVRESAARYREVVENASELIATVDVDSCFTSVNAAFAKSLGYEREELLGKRLLELVPPEHHDRLAAARESKYEGDGGTTTYEHDFVAKDGHRIRVEVATQILLEDGRPAGVQAICRDITARSDAERALRAAEERYRMLVEGLPLVTFVHPVGRDAAPTYISPQVERLLGYPQSEWLERRSLFWEAIHPEDAERLREAEATHEPFTRFRMRAKDGREVWLHGERQVVRDDDGRPLYVQGFWLDITDQYRAETALHESRELYRLVVENARDMIGIFGPDGRFLFASPSHLQVLGYHPSELIGQHAANFRHPDDAGTVTALVADSTAATSGVPLCHRLRHRDGHYVDVEGFAVPILNEDGSLRLIVGTGRDITDRLRAEELAEQLRQAQKMEAIGRLAGGVAHDFNNLLTVIVGYSDLARIRTDVPGIHDAVEQVSSAARTASDLTQQLLAFSRQQVIQPRPVDLGALVWSTKVLLDRLVGEDVTLELAIGTELPSINADPNQIEQVLMNLAANAREAMPHGGAVLVQARRLEVDEMAASELVGVEPGSYVALSVADTGVGMDEETRSRIFEPFFTTKEDGTGLGLATVHGIVTQSGGLISVESTPGEGTTFTLLFPAVEERPQAAAPPEEVVAGDLGGTQTVLVVEDEEAVRELAAEVLTSHGYTVLAASTGEEALALLEQRTQPLDLVLSDVMLPGMKGPTLVEELRRRHPEAQTIFTSGYAPALIGEGGVQSEEPFLAKPFTATALAAKVREVLNDGAAHRPGRVRV